MRPLQYYIKHPRILVSSFVYRNSKYFGDKLYLSLLYWSHKGTSLNWEAPRTFCEKLQWLKLYNRIPEYTVMADKVKAKDWVADRIGQEYIIPTLGVWEKTEEIDFGALPNRFVLKCNHNSGLGMYICKDKHKMPKQRVLNELKKGLKENYYLHWREWPYRDIPRLILAEPFLEAEEGTTCLTDYKFFCFNGEPRYCQVIKDRTTKETIDFFDMDWRHQEFVGLNPAAGPAAVRPRKPMHFAKMKEIVRTLAEGMPFSRIDLYEVGGKVYFGEITFFPAGGMGIFTPQEYDEILGDMITLPFENDKSSI